MTHATATAVASAGPAHESLASRFGRLASQPGAWRIGAGYPLKDSHRILGSLLDALFVEDYGSDVDAVFANPPTAARIVDLLTALAPNHPALAENFKCDVPAVFAALKRDDILASGLPLQARWRTLVDRQHVDVLGSKGIDTSNPLLCLIYESIPQHVSSVIDKLKATARLIDAKAPIDEKAIAAIASAGLRANVALGVRYGAMHDHEGSDALIGRMSLLCLTHGIPTFIIGNGNIVFFDPQNQSLRLHDWAPDTNTHQALLDSRELDIDFVEVDRIKDIIVDAARPDDAIHEHGIGRTLTNSAVVLRALKMIPIMYSIELTRAETLDERLFATARLVQNLDHLHPFDDFNYTTLVKCMLHMAMAALGQPLTEIYEPGRAEGMSDRQFVQCIQEGQAWRQSVANDGTALVDAA